MPKYVVRYETGKFMDFDSTSGGYPYETSIENAHVFTDVKKAASHIGSGSFDGIEVYELTYTIKKVDLKAELNKLYQEELAKLKEKYGVA